MRRLSALLLLVTLAVACGDQATAPGRQASAPPSAPNLNTVVNELIFAWPIRITWLDSQGPWDVLLLGYEPADDYDCNGGTPVRGIPVRRHFVFSQETSPVGTRDQAAVHTVGRAPLYMYRRADFPPPGATSAEWCTFLTTGFIASGSWTAMMTSDNDISGFDGTPGNNSWGGTETGTLLGTDGTRYKYEWKYRGLCNPDWGCRMTHSTDHVERVGN